MSDFDLNKSKWFNSTGIDRASKWVRDDAASMLAYVQALASFEYDAQDARQIDKAETALSEALLAIKLAKAEYAKRKPVLQAAE